MVTRFEAIATTTAGREVVGADDKRYSAMLGQDWPVLEGLLHDDLVYAHSNGDRDSKQSYLEKVTAGRPVYVGIDMKERFVAAWDEVALLHGRVGIHVEVRGDKKSVDILYQSVWVRGANSWQMLGWSSTKTNLGA